MTEYRWTCPQCSHVIIAFSNEGLYTRRSMHEKVHTLEKVMAGLEGRHRYTPDDVAWLRKMHISLAPDNRSPAELLLRYRLKPGDIKSQGF